MSTPKKKIIIPVINDLATDQRVLRLCQWWYKKNYHIILYGRILPNSPEMPKVPYEVHRVKHFFNKGMCFYAEYSIRLFFFLLFHKSDKIWANDLDTLPASGLAKWLGKTNMLIYDSHEYFTEVPELQSNPFAKNVWLFFERTFVPKVDYAFTVNKSIADVYTKLYGIPFHVLRNMPFKREESPLKSRSELGLPENKFLVILQGSGINMHRGAEEAVDAFIQLPNDFALIIAGAGDVIPQLKEAVANANASEKVLFFNRMPFQELMQYTRACDLGLSLDKDTNLNYRYSLPNKIFDYIQANIPVLVSDLPELRRVVYENQVGIVLAEHSPKAIADAILSLKENVKLYTELKKNTFEAAKLLCREKEENVLDIIPL